MKPTVEETTTGYTVRFIAWANGYYNTQFDKAGQWMSIQQYNSLGRRIRASTNCIDHARINGPRIYNRWKSR